MLSKFNCAFKTLTEIEIGRQTEGNYTDPEFNEITWKISETNNTKKVFHIVISER